MHNTRSRIIIEDLDSSYLSFVSEEQLEYILGGRSLFYYIAYGIGAGARKLYDDILE